LDLAAELDRLAADDEAVEFVRKTLEDVMVEWRDSSMFTANRNGLAIHNKDGSPSPIIRIGTGMAVGMALRALAKHVRGDGDV
jgi:hypothetical protein